MDNKPLWFDDKFSVVAAISMTYLLIATAGSVALAGGTVTGTASGHTR